jgi:hypothetical protein
MALFGVSNHLALVNYGIAFAILPGIAGGLAEKLIYDFVQSPL